MAKARKGARPATPPRGQLVEANSASRALNILGDRWTLAILYFCFQGARRFDDFQGRIGIARSLLDDRLTRLQAAGVLQRVRYQERPPRDEYRLSKMGRDLFGVALTIIAWEKRWFYDRGNAVHRLTHDCGKECVPELRCCACNECISARDVAARPGPGAGVEPSPPARSQRRSIVPQEALNHGHPMLDRAFQILGDRWTSHVIASAFMGHRRFADLQNALGIATNILSDRLVRLVELGVLRRELYQVNPERWEYRLTDMGRDLYPLIVELSRWGDAWLAGGKGRPLILHHRPCKRLLKARLVCDKCGQELRPDSLRLPTRAPAKRARVAKKSG